MANDVDHIGDYSYDLAHEVRSVVVPRQRTTSVAAIRGVPFEPDLDADYGYDQAHEV